MLSPIVDSITAKRFSKEATATSRASRTLSNNESSFGEQFEMKRAAHKITSLATSHGLLARPCSLHAHYYTAGINPVDNYAMMDEIDADGNPCVTLLFMRHMCKIIVDDSTMQADEWVSLQIPTTGNKQAVIERLTDLLTKEDYTKHPKEVPAAIHEEVKIWVKYNCFERAPRKGAKHI